MTPIYLFIEIQIIRNINKMGRQLLRAFVSPYMPWSWHESSLPFSDIESNSTIHMSFCTQAVHLLGWIVLTWMH